jgi:hypothetical protein
MVWLLSSRNYFTTRCGHEVLGMTLLHNLKGAMQPDHSNMSVNVSTYNYLQFQPINTSGMEAVTLIRCVHFHVLLQI